ncbi:MAG: hypothetical protein JNL39_16080 [Opitutaceae bacterium]|nr:hypothetical protein [Opitutaceae bacterium]
MNAKAAECIVFKPAALLPDAWGSFPAHGPVRCFNPGLLRDGNGWILAYRVVGPDGLRRIALCRLDAAFRIVAGSALPLTDRVRFRRGTEMPEVATKWFADPRLYRFGGQVFVYWNSGWHEPRNHQFLQELDATTLVPRGHPRELLLRGERQKLEKNWTLFAGAGNRLHALYSITPHRVLELSVAGDGDIVCEEIARCEWTPAEYPACHGGLRGGAPPVESEGKLWVFGHSVHDGADGYRYAAVAYACEATRPFAPALQPVQPLALGNPFGTQRAHGRLNPAVDEVIYPCGAARDGARWVVSHGINDEHCAISLVDHTVVLATVRPFATGR